MRAPRINLKPRERRILFLALGALLAGLAYVEFVEPVTQQWLTARREAGRATAELDRLQTLVNRREEIQSAYGRVRDTVATGDTEEAVQLAVLNEVSRLATGCGLEVDSLKPLRKVRESGFERYGVDLSGRCAVPALLDLLQSLQTPEHLLKAEKVTVVVGRSTPPLTVTIRISKFARVERTSGAAL